jgi:hypothetical protein
VASRSTKSDSPVAAREQMDEQQGQTGPDPKQQRAEVRAEDAPAAARAGTHANTPTRGGFMDQLSRRSGADALEGHYVTIDLNHKDVKQAFEDKFGTDDDGNLNHTGDFGVYLEPQLRNPDTGIPETISVRLRDDTHALVVVPYEACRPAGPRGRS